MKISYPVDSYCDRSTGRKEIPCDESSLPDLARKICRKRKRDALACIHERPFCRFAGCSNGRIIDFLSYLNDEAENAGYSFIDRAYDMTIDKFANFLLQRRVNAMEWIVPGTSVRTFHSSRRS